MHAIIRKWIIFHEIDFVPMTVGILRCPHFITIFPICAETLEKMRLFTYRMNRKKWVGGWGGEENWESHLNWTGCVWRWPCNRNSVRGHRKLGGSRGFMISCMSLPLLHGKGRVLWCVQASGSDTCRGSRPCRLSSSLTHGNDVVSHTLTGLRHMSWYFHSQTRAAISWLD